MSGILQEFNMYCQIMNKKHYELILEQIVAPFPGEDDYDQYYYYAYFGLYKKAMKKIKLIEFHGHDELIFYRLIG